MDHTNVCEGSPMWWPCASRLREAGRPYAYCFLELTVLSTACCCVQDATNVGDEGGFAPSINSTTEGWTSSWRPSRRAPVPLSVVHTTDQKLQILILDY